MAKNDKTVKRGVYLYIDGQRIKNDVGSIKAEIKRLTNELKDMTIGSREYVEQMAKIRNLNSMLRDHQRNLRGVNREVNNSTFSFGKFVDGFNRFGGFIASVVASLTGLILGLRALRDEQNKLEDSQAGLKALTGLDDSSVAWLTEQAKLLSTTLTKEGLRVRASANEILDAYMLVGSAKPELLGNKEALAAVTEEAMRLQSAAGDIQLDAAVNAVTLALNQFGAPAEEAGRYVNVLAAGSKEGAANIASITSSLKSSGVAAAAANVSIEETVGMIETLAYSGIKDEVAGTALKKFFLVLQTGADDTNPKVVGLAKALENLRDKNMSAEDIKKMFGEEGYNAASVLIQNTDMVNRLTEAVTDTNVAFEQSAINSDTASAKLAQVRNEMKLAGIELIEKLNPAFLVSTNAMTYVVKILPGVIDWFQKWGAEIVVISGYFLLLATRVTVTNKAVAAYNALLAAGTAIKKGYAMAILAVNAAQDMSLRGLVNMRNALRSSNVLTRATTAVITLLKSAFFLLTGQVKAAGIAFKAFSIAARANPFGIILTLVTALTLGFVRLNKTQTEAAAVQESLSRIEKKASEEIDKKTSRIKVLNDILHNNNVSLGKRKEALDELKSIIPDYNALLTDEGELIKDNTTAIDDYLVSLEKEIKLKAAKAELEEAYNKQVKLEAQRDAQQRILDANKGNTSQTINTSFGAFNFDPLDHNRSKLRDINAELSRTNAVISAINERIASASSGLPSSTTSGGNEGGGGGGGGGSNAGKDKFAKIELEYQAESNRLQRLYLEGQFETESEFAAAKIDLEKKFLQQKLDVLGIEPAEREKILSQILQAEAKFNDLCKKEDEEASKERKSIRDRQLQIELEQAAQHHYRNFTSEDEYQKELRGIYAQYYDDLLKNFQLTEEQKTDIMNEQNKLQTEADREKYEKLMSQASMYRDIAMDIASEFGESIGEMIANGELSIQNFMKQTILLALDALERIIEITSLEITAKNIAATTPFNWIGAAKAAAEVAAIKAAFALVKGLVSNFYTGGYTPSGDWDQPQGIVHSNEFVANRFAVANPAVRPVLDLIDAAQRSGTIANLTGNDIAAVAGGRSVGSASAPSAVNPNSQPNNMELVATVRRLNQVINRLSARLDEPIEAVGVISGRHGWKQKLDDYDNLLHNKSRKG